MSVFTSIGIILLSILIIMFLQLVPGIFAVFYHTLAGKFSKYRASHIALFFILGTEVAFTMFFLLCYTFCSLLNSTASFLAHPAISWIAAGILIALGIFFALSYFRPSSGTELFISRPFAHKCQAKVGFIKTRSDAFLLGFTSIIPEFIFTLPLFFLSALAFTDLPITYLPRAALILLFIVFAILPLIIIYVAFNRYANLADYLKFRFKYKPFVRFFVPFVFFTIAILIILGATI